MEIMPLQALAVGTSMDRDPNRHVSAYPSFPQRTAFRTGMILRFLAGVRGRRCLSFGSFRRRRFPGPAGSLAYRKSEQAIIIRSQFLQNRKRYWSKPGSMVG